MIRFSDILLSLVSLIFVIVFVNFSLSPFSLLNFFGAIAGTATALCVLRGIKLLPNFFLSLAFVMFLAYFFFGVSFNAEFILFGVLATALQSAWATQLTSKEIKNTAWLASRAHLTSFLIKLGPLSSLVSAVAVLILIAVSNQEYQSGLLYAFLLSWSLSLLIAVFLLSVIFFSTDVPQLSKNKRVQVVFASVLAIVALSFLLRVSHNDYQHKRQDEFYAAVNHISNFIDKRFTAIELQLATLNGLFQASENISSAEFYRFSRSIHQSDSGVVALEWIPVVNKEKQAAFEHWAIRNNVDYTPIANVKATDEFLAPLYFSYAESNYRKQFGKNLIENEHRKAAMISAARQKVAVSSSPLTLIQNDIANVGLYVFQPIFNVESINPFGGISVDGNANLDGFVSTVVYITPIFDQLSADIQTEKVTISLQDVSASEPYVLYGELSNTINRLQYVIEKEEFNRSWHITITEKTAWLAQPRNWLNWGVLVGCTLGGLLFQMLILLMTAYSSELNRRVTDKTRELILQKEQSEKQNKAKSKLLLNLSKELKTPISALNGLTLKLHHEAEPTAIAGLIDKITSVSENIEQSIDTLADLSAIEAGNLVFQQQSFDFHLFLQQMETMLNVSTDKLANSVEFQLDDSVPHYVLGDKLRLQQLVVALTHNSALIFNTSKLALSVKAHRHQQGTATIFIVVTPVKGDNKATAIPDEIAKKEYEHLTTSMTMAKEICQRLDGAVKLAPVAETGDYMLSASLKLSLDSNSLRSLRLDSTLLDLSDKHALIISDEPSGIAIIKGYLDKHGCKVTLYPNVNEITLAAIKNDSFDIIFMNCLFSNESGASLNEAIRYVRETMLIPVVGIAPELISNKQKEVLSESLDTIISKPIKPFELNNIVHQYL